MRSQMEIGVFNAVIVSKLVYGLETLNFTKSIGQKLNTFQMKGPRKIMKIPPTHIDRSWSNRKVYQEANKELAKSSGKNRKVGKLRIKPVIELIDKKKIH